jgi:GNAT superfamily N-acetyltransferase
VSADPPDPRIVHLIDAPGAAETLVRWFVEAWEPWYGPEGAGDAASDIAACSSRDDLPLCRVALGPDGDVLGTASLRRESVGSEHGLGPWLAGLLVGEAHRGRGIARALIEAIENDAARLGYAAIYTSTDAPEESMRRRGWTRIGSAESLRGSIAIFRRAIGSGMK